MSKSIEIQSHDLTKKIHPRRGDIQLRFPWCRRSAIHCRHCRSYRSRCHLLQRLGRCKLRYFRSFSYHTLHHVNPLSRYHQSKSQKVFQDNGSQHHFLPHRRNLHPYHPCAFERCVWLGSFRNRLGCGYSWHCAELH